MQTNAEYRKLMLTYKSANVNEGASPFPEFSKPLPKSVDWKAEGYVTEVGNQVFILNNNNLVCFRNNTKMI